MRRLGVKPDRIHVAHGGPVTAELFAGAQTADVSDADHRVVLTLADHLLRKRPVQVTVQSVGALLARVRKSVSDDDRLLVVYSGHGDHLEGKDAKGLSAPERLSLFLPAGGAGLAEDPNHHLRVFSKAATKPAKTEETEETAAVEPLVLAGQANQITIIDACFGRPAAPSQAALRSTSDQPVPKGAFAAFNGKGAVVVACQADEAAVETFHNGRPHGAFTAALLSVLDHWRVDSVHEAVRLSYSELQDRTLRQLEAWEVEQKPLVHEESRVGRWRLLETAASKPEQVDNGPLRTLGERQIIVDGVRSGDGFIFRLVPLQTNGGSTTSTTTEFMRILATGKEAAVTWKGWQFQGDTEHIRVYESGLGELRDAVANSSATHWVQVTRVPKVIEGGVVNKPQFLQQLTNGVSSLYTLDRTPSVSWREAQPSQLKSKRVSKEPKNRVAFHWVDKTGLFSAKVDRLLQIRFSDGGDLADVYYCTREAVGGNVFFKVMLKGGNNLLSATLLSNNKLAPKPSGGWRYMREDLKTLDKI